MYSRYCTRPRLWSVERRAAAQDVCTPWKNVLLERRLTEEMEAEERVS
jgi:hypothetical protein